MKKITLLNLLFGLVLVAQPGPNEGTVFNGIDQFIVMPDSDNINTTTVRNRTIETYFKVADGTNRQVFYKEGAQVNTIKFYVENGNLHVGSYRNNGGSNKSIWFRTPVNNDTWYHVALVLDNASRLLFYLDGQLQATNFNYFELPQHPGNFEIARTQGPARYPNCNTWETSGNVQECLGNVTNNDTTTLFFGGSLWGFRSWDDVRTAQEIMDNMNVLITDPESAEGEDLIAFLDGYTMTFKDDNGDFDNEDAQGGVLSLDKLTKDEFRVVIDDANIRVLSTSNLVPDQMVLFDLLGQQVLQTSAALKMSKSTLSTGIYILRIYNNGEVSNKKLLIRN